MQLTAEPTAAAHLGLPCSAGQLLVDVLALHLVVAACATSLRGVATCRQRMQGCRSDWQQVHGGTQRCAPHNSTGLQTCVETVLALIDCSHHRLPACLAHMHQQIHNHA